MYDSLIREPKYTRFLSIRFCPDTIKQLEVEALEKGYGKKCKSGKIKLNITRLIREIVEAHCLGKK